MTAGACKLHCSRSFSCILPALSACPSCSRLNQMMARVTGTSEALVSASPRHTRGEHTRSPCPTRPLSCFTPTPLCDVCRNWLKKESQLFLGSWNQSQSDPMSFGLAPWRFFFDHLSSAVCCSLCVQNCLECSVVWKPWRKVWPSLVPDFGITTCITNLVKKFQLCGKQKAIPSEWFLFVRFSPDNKE